MGTILEGLTNVMHLLKNFHCSCARHRDMVHTVPNTRMQAYLGAEPAMSISTIMTLADHGQLETVPAIDQTQRVY